MNDKFNSLPQEKQRSIIKAATEVFGKNEYKKASTDLIASKAGVSKGLLFYYFKNKKELYLYVYNYLVEMMTAAVSDPGYKAITDFFQLLEYFSRQKYYILEEIPSIMDFAMRAFYSDREAVSEDLKDIHTQMKQDLYHKYFDHTDFSKFIDEADPYKVYEMMIWMGDGYLHEYQISHQSWSLEELMEEFKSWIRLLRKALYKEEYKHECN